MPKEIQEQMVHSLPGLANAKILKYGYAIEYDAIYPTQLKNSLETKIIENLFTAGQINGTSGYEEAACQGLIAGINAALKLESKAPLVLKRNEAYIGVLIDDLITKGIRDPYRLLTSRAEYRLLLRNDNADIRLRKYGYDVGLVSKEQYDLFKQKEEKIEKLIEQLKTSKVTSKDNKYLESLNSTPIKDGLSLYNLLKRPEIEIEEITKFFNDEYTDEEKNIVSIMIKYEGYIAKAQKEALKMIKMEDKKIPERIDYNKVPNLASEARQKLKEVKPASIGQASRISGVNPADISVLMVYLKKGEF
jgi:tRNA uridine 5-carboxymethylaminomethyl modification enzyme